MSSIWRLSQSGRSTIDIPQNGRFFTLNGQHASAPSLFGGFRSIGRRRVGYRSHVSTSGLLRDVYRSLPRSHYRLDIFYIWVAPWNAEAVSAASLAIRTDLPVSWAG